MATTYRLEYLTENEFERWDRFVDESDEGSIYNKSCFLRALCEAAGTQFRILTVWKGEEILGGVGLHFEKSKYGDIVHPRGLLYYNGLVLKNLSTKHPSDSTYRQMEIIRAMLRELEDKKYASIELSNRHTLTDIRAFTWDGWHVWPRYTYEVPICDLDRLWDKAEQNARRLIVRCEKAGMLLQVNDDFDTFYALHQDTYERKGLPPYFQLERFKALYNSLKARNCAQIFFATLPGGKPVAAQIVLYSGHPVTHTWVAGADRQYLQTGASAFLRWKVFEELNKRGFAYNDLTDAMEQKVAKFKSQFGGNLMPCFVVSKVNSSSLRIRNRVFARVLHPFSFLMRKLSNPRQPTEGSGSDQ